jgi:hypothetical protein
MMCVRKLIPDRSVQQKTTNAINKKKMEYKQENTFSNERMSEYAAHMETFTEVMIYLNEGMDLIHSDIVGAMTRRAAEAALEPDRPPKFSHPEEMEPVKAVENVPEEMSPAETAQQEETPPV